MNELDQTLFLWLNLSPLAPAWVFQLARASSQYLPHWLLAATLAVALTGRPLWRGQAWRVLASVALASVAAYLLKRGFDHPRPFALGLGRAWLPHGASEGFPSSHASTAMAFAVSACLAPVRWPARLLVLGAALAVSWSRVALGLHFPSDVLMAWVVGTLCALGVQWLGARPARRWPCLRVSLPD